MSYPKVIDVITAQEDKSSQQLASGKKWKQAQRLINWIIDRAPQNSQIELIGYAVQAQSFSNGYIKKTDFSSINGLKNKVLSTSPIGGTNLLSAVQYVNNLSPKPTNVYIVTDGLPTLTDSKKSKLSGCKSSKVFVSGRCRESIFWQASRAQRHRVKIDVFLLHMEGDPSAAPLYSAWASSTGGSIFSVPKGWP